MRALVLVALGALAGCSGPANPNPPQLWIAPDGSELHLKLQPIEPPYF
jgi:hypothetical protein